MKYIAINFDSDPSWILEETDDYLIYDRGEKDWDLPKDKVIKTANVGHVDYDKLSYLVDNYDNLPEVFYWGKVNLWKSITKEEFDAVKNCNTFMPLLTKNHKIYSDRLGVVCYYDENGMFNERNDSWWFNAVPSRWYNNFKI